MTIGNAIIQQPALFGAAIDNVGDTNGVRDEFAEGGPSNIPEFGTNTNPVGFKALLATDAYVQMKPGVAYPAVLAITGANDPRVAPWIVAKFIAKLQRSTTSGKPVTSTPTSTRFCSGSSAIRTLPIRASLRRRVRRVRAAV